MLKKVLLLVFIYNSLQAESQVTLSIQLPHGGMVQKEQLWNIVMVHNNNSMLEVIIMLDLQDAVTGQIVLSGAGRKFSVGKGVKMISAKDVQPIQYNYVASEFNSAYIPLGSYIACYRVVGSDLKSEPLGDECVRININPLSPPMLNTPSDGIELETPYPLLTWIPPAPLDMFSDINYELVVSEIFEGQSPQEALSFNTPVYSARHIRTSYERYPSTLSRLQEGRHYAWQVTAKNGLNYAAQTEIWTFRMKPADSTTVLVSTVGYLVLKTRDENTGIHYVSTNDLQVKYYSYDKDRTTKVRFLSPAGKVVKELKQKIRYGNNFMRFSIPVDFKKGALYTVEITDVHHTSYSGRFILQ